MPGSNLIISLHGIGASQGIAIGKVYVVERGHIEVREKRLAKSRIEAEVRRFKKALALARIELDGDVTGSFQDAEGAAHRLRSNPLLGRTTIYLDFTDIKTVDIHGVVPTLGVCDSRLQ